jgi:ubiquinone/menaquinone biosynthesis C-methylase UbiE
VGFWDDQVVPRFTDKMLSNRDVMRHRAKVTDGLHGEVVEIGFGSGLNVPSYPESVTKVYAVDPSLVARDLASARVEASPVEVRYVGLDGATLPLDDASVDTALSTFTLCTIPDVTSAVHEVRRVLKPGGTFHFLEHGLSPEPGIAQWQHRLNGVQQRVAGGCHLDRPIEQLIRDAGFEITRLDHDRLAGPKFMQPWSYLYEGVATRMGEA